MKAAADAPGSTATRLEGGCFCGAVRYSAADEFLYAASEGHDADCRSCGSLLYSVVRDSAYVHVALGKLADDPAIRPEGHIFVGSKAAVVLDSDDLPQAQEL